MILSKTETIDMKKDQIAETLKMLKTNVNLRTILCSATIEIKSKRIEKNSAKVPPKSRRILP